MARFIPLGASDRDVGTLRVRFGNRCSRCVFQLRQLSQQFADAFTSPLKFLKFRGGGITLFKEFRLPIYQAAQFDADLWFIVIHISHQVAALLADTTPSGAYGKYRIAHRRMVVALFCIGHSMSSSLEDRIRLLTDRAIAD